MENAKIMVIDDQPEMQNLIKLFLEEDNFQVLYADNGTQALEIARVEQPNLFILDVMLPGIDGIEVCKRLRRETNVPILFVSCKDLDTDKVLGLMTGADDYITKPFSPKELVARIKAHLRRYSQLGADPELPAILYFPGLKIDIVNRVATVQDRMVLLSGKEFDILVLLARHPNQVFSVGEIYRAVWKADSLGDARTVLVHLSNLRKKIEQELQMEDYIVTIRGEGYRFAGNPTPKPSIKLDDLNK